MTTPNKITLARIVMIPVFVIFAIYYGQSVRRGQPVEWLRFAAIVTFLIAGMSDGLDGYIARRYNQKSSLGVILDPIADKGLMLCTILTLSLTDWSDIDSDSARFPIWFPVVVITRDIVLMVGAMVVYFLNGSVQVKTRWTGKIATFFQIAAIAWLMLQLRFVPLIVIVVIAGLFTLISGIHYVADGVRQLQASGHAHAKPL